MWIQKIPAGASALTFGPDGHALYVLDTRGQITAWHPTARTQQPVYRIMGETRLSMGELSTACEGQFLVVSLPSVVEIWDTRTGTEHARLPLERNGFSPALDSTRRLLVGPDAQREVLTTWDIATRTPGPPLLRSDPNAPVRFGSVAMTADGNTIAVGTARREIILYDRTAGREFARLDLSPAVGPVLQFTFSTDGKTLALVGLDYVTLWDVPTRTMRKNRVRCLMPSHLSAFHPSLPIMAARNSDSHITLFNLESGDPIRSLDFALGKYVMCAAFSPDGLTCAVGGSNKRFAVFDVDL